MIRLCLGFWLGFVFESCVDVFCYLWCFRCCLSCGGMIAGLLCWWVVCVVC